MSEPQTNTLMPSRPHLVTEAIARLDTAGLRSQLLELDSATMHDLCMRLVDRTVSIRAAHTWLNAELGGGGDNQVVDDNAVYRFANHFRRLYDQVRAERARMAARARVLDTSDGDIKSMTRAAQQMVIEAVTERMLDQDTDELDIKELNAIALVVRRAQRSQAEAETVEIARQQAEQRAAKLEQEIEKLRTENRNKKHRVAEQVAQLEDQLNRLQKSIERGQKVDPKVFSGIRVNLDKLRHPTPEEDEAA